MGNLKETVTSERMETKITIEEIKVKRTLDECADLSHLGEYTDEPDKWNICCSCGEYVSDCGHDSPTAQRRACRYFNPVAGDEKPGSDDYQKYGKEDYERAEAYNRQEWYTCGVRAYAVVSLPHRTETLSSCGLYGIESDIGDEHFHEIKTEQLHELKEHLQAFGVDVSNFDELAAAVELED